jgi:opacity protein-like surface antigen
MKKILLMAASVALLATAAIPASAQSWSFGFSTGNNYGNYGGYNRGYGYNRNYYNRGYGGYRGYYNPYDAYVQQYR